MIVDCPLPRPLPRIGSVFYMTWLRLGLRKCMHAVRVPRCKRRVLPDTHRNGVPFSPLTRSDEPPRDRPPNTYLIAPCTDNRSLRAALSYFQGHKHGRLPVASTLLAVAEEGVSNLDVGTRTFCALRTRRYIVLTTTRCIISLIRERPPSSTHN